MSNPLVSIVIPCFNAEKYVENAIESCLAQSYPNIEIIVVDDGSKDNSVAVLQKYRGRILMETGPNRGGSAARNRGIQLAKGDLIQFLDADDLLAPNKLELQVPLALADENRLVFCDVQYSQEGQFHPHHCRTESIGDSVVFMVQGGLTVLAPLHHRWWVDKLSGFRVSLPCSQERDFHLRIAALGVQFHRLPQTLATINQVEGSVSSNSVRVFKQHLSIAQEVWSILETNGGDSKLRKSAIARFVAESARKLVRAGCWNEAHSAWKQACEWERRSSMSAYGNPWMRILISCFGWKTAEKISQFAFEKAKNPFK